MPQRNTVNVVAGIIYQDNKLLLCRRKDGKAHAGLWEFPGGKIEIHEGKKEALYREIKEELGIEITIKEFFAQSKYSYPTFDIILWVFSCDYNSGEITLLDHDKFEWITPNKLLQYKLSPADIEIVQKLTKRL